jgi:hypothetical protein
MTIGRYRLMLAIAGLSLLATPATAQCPADRELARLVAMSDRIVVGRLEITPELAERIRAGERGYLDIPVAVSQTIRGPEAAPLVLHFYPDSAAYHPSNDALLASGSARTTFFLTEANGQFYFAGDTPSALQPSTGAAAATAETARQDAALKHWRTDRALPHYQTVHDLIAQLGTVSGSAQQRVFDRLIALGKPAVPAIIAQMDDRRPLRAESISLKNGPDSFEATRHYGPALVVDGLDAVLDQITDTGLGSVYNGGTDTARAAAIARWRVYAMDLACPA